MELLAVFGNPVAHSRSPEIHHMFASQVGIDVEYRKILVPENSFSAVARRFLDEGGRGFNITVPNKIDAFNFVDELSPEAQRAEAVNTVVRRKDDRLYGHNTDGPGLARDLTENLGWQLESKRILVLGAGGAVQGILESLLAKKPAAIVLLNRTVDKAVSLAEKFSDRRLSATTLNEVGEGYDLIISGSSAGLTTNEPLALPAQLLTNMPLCYDMIYGRETPFLRWCNMVPADKRADGLGMLVEQAALSFETWFGVSVETRPVIQTLRNQM